MPTPIEPNFNDSYGARGQRVASQATKTSFSTVANDVTGAFGPAAAIATQQYGSPKGAAIVAASINGAAGMNYGNPGLASGAIYGGYSQGLSSGYGGGLSNVGLSPDLGSSTPVSSDPVANAQQLLNESQASSVSMLMVQNEMGMQTRTFNSVSNLMNARDSMVMNILRNTRGLG